MSKVPKIEVFCLLYKKLTRYHKNADFQKEFRVLKIRSRKFDTFDFESFL